MDFIHFTLSCVRPCAVFTKQAEEREMLIAERREHLRVGISSSSATLHLPCLCVCIKGSGDVQAGEGVHSL
jgi:hypothetical protein